MNESTILQMLVLVGIIGVVLISEYLHHRKCTKWIYGRKNFEISELYQQFYENSPEVEIGDLEFAYAILERIFQIPRGYIRPSDKFGMELGQSSPLSQLDTLEVEDFYLEVDNMMRHCKIDQWEVIQVNDYVKLVSICLKRGYNEENSTI